MFDSSEEEQELEAELQMQMERNLSGSEIDEDDDIDTDLVEEAHQAAEVINRRNAKRKNKTLKTMKEMPKERIRP